MSKCLNFFAHNSIGPEELLNPHALPEDVDVLGSIDEDGNDLITASGDNYYNGH